MINQIQKIKEEISAFQIKNRADTEKFRIYFLGSKGLIKNLYTQLRDISKEHKKEEENSKMLNSQQMTEASGRRLKTV